MVGKNLNCNKNYFTRKQWKIFKEKGKNGGFV